MSVAYTFLLTSHSNFKNYMGVIPIINVYTVYLHFHRIDYFNNKTNHRTVNY